MRLQAFDANCFGQVDEGKRRRGNHEADQNNRIKKMALCKQESPTARFWLEDSQKSLFKMTGLDEPHSTDSEDLKIVIAPSTRKIVLNDVSTLDLGLSPRNDCRWIVEGVDVSERFHQFKKESLDIACHDGLFVESHIQEIL
jgi:hypothetical protein